jgi:hypothetical protein
MFRPGEKLIVVAHEAVGPLRFRMPRALVARVLGAEPEWEAERADEPPATFCVFRPDYRESPEMKRKLVEYERRLRERYPLKKK